MEELKKVRPNTPLDVSFLTQSVSGHPLRSCDLQKLLFYEIALFESSVVYNIVHTRQELDFRWEADLQEECERLCWRNKSRTGCALFPQVFSVAGQVCEVET